MHKKKKTILFIFILAFLIRLVIVIGVERLPNYDALGYEQRALSILDGEGYAINGKPTSFKPPLYSFLLAIIYFLFGASNYLAVLVIQSVIGAIICVIIYFIARDIFNEKIGLVAAIIASFNIAFIKIGGHLLSECFFTFFVSLAVLFYIRLMKHHNLRDAILFGFICGLALLTRSVIVLFPFLAVVFIFLKLFKKNLAFKKIILLCFVSLLAFFITFIPWTIRNYKVHNSVVFISTAGGRAFYAAYCPPEGKLFGFNSIDETMQLSEQIDSETTRDKFFYKRTFKFIGENLNKLPKLTFLKVLFFWSPFDWEVISLDGRGIYNFTYAFFIPFAFAGLLFAAKSKEASNISALYLPVIYFQGMALIFYGSPRFRIPIESFLIIFAAFALVKFFTKFKNRLLSLSIAGGYLVLNLVLAVYSNNLRILAKDFFRSFGLW